MQLSVPPSLGNQAFQTHPVLGPMGPQMGQFAGGFGNIGTIGNLNAAVGTSLGVQRDSRSMSGSKPSELIMGGSTPAPSVLSPTVEPIRPVNDHGNLKLLYFICSCLIALLMFSAYFYMINKCMVRFMMHGVWQRKL